MIQRIAGGESLNDKPTRFVELGRDQGVAAAETAQEDAGEPLTEFICQERSSYSACAVPPAGMFQIMARAGHQSLQRRVPSLKLSQSAPLHIHHLRD